MRFGGLWFESRFSRAVKIGEQGRQEEHIAKQSGDQSNQAQFRKDAMVSGIGS
jgi:hypothetical protein